MSGTQYAANMPAPGSALVDPDTGVMTHQWYRYFLQLFGRTGGAVGMSASGALAVALAALSAATTAQGSATAAQLTAAAALLEAELGLLMEDPEAIPKRPDPVLFALMLEG